LKLELKKVIINGDETVLKGLMTKVQYFRSYNFSINSIAASIGANLHHTALHKLLNIDVSKLKNTHAPLLQINKIFYDKLVSIFQDSKDYNKLIYNLNYFF